MLFLIGTLPPVAIYLLALGWINRRPRPVLASGAWDFAGVLFALSGVLLIGGPAFLNSLDERSRLFWLMGETGSGPAGADRGASLWVLARVLYFAVVAGASAFVLWRYRRLTSIYNVDPRGVLLALPRAFQRLGLDPVRTGDLFAFHPPPPGRPAPAAARADAGENVQDGLPAPRTGTDHLTLIPAQALRRPAELRVDAFPLMRHVTLRWEPADAPFRRQVETELARELAQTPGPEHEPVLGGCLWVLGLTLFGLALLAGFALFLFRWMPQ